MIALKHLGMLCGYFLATLISGLIITSFVSWLSIVFGFENTPPTTGGLLIMSAIVAWILYCLDPDL